MNRLKKLKRRRFHQLGKSEVYVNVWAKEVWISARARATVLKDIADVIELHKFLSSLVKELEEKGLTNVP